MSEKRLSDLEQSMVKLKEEFANFKTLVKTSLAFVLGVVFAIDPAAFITWVQNIFGSK